AGDGDGGTVVAPPREPPAPPDERAPPTDLPAERQRAAESARRHDRIVDGERERAAAPAGADVEREATASCRHGLRRRHALDGAEQVEGRYQPSAEHEGRPAVAPNAQRTEDALDA